MRPSDEVRTLLQTLGSAALGIALGLGVLGIGFVVSRVTLGDDRGSAAQAPSLTPPTATTVRPSPSRSPSPSPTPAPTPTLAPATTPAPAPTPTAAATAEPLVVSAYTNGGKRYAALRAPVGYTFSAPFAGTVDVSFYQLDDAGDVRIGSNFPDRPFYPYVTVASADRKLVLRPGARGTDVQVIVRDGASVDAGAPLFKTVGDGASSWRAFYDRGVTAQVIASLATAGGAELDPVPLFSR